MWTEWVGDIKGAHEISFHGDSQDSKIYGSSLARITADSVFPWKVQTCGFINSTVLSIIILRLDSSELIKFNECPGIIIGNLWVV